MRVHINKLGHHWFGMFATLDSADNNKMTAILQTFSNVCSCKKMYFDLNFNEAYS